MRDLTNQAFMLVEKLAKGEQNLQEQAEELMAKYKLVQDLPEVIEEFTDGLSIELPNNRKVGAATSKTRRIYIEFTNNNLITDLTISEEAFMAMIVCVSKSLWQKGQFFAEYPQNPPEKSIDRPLAVRTNSEEFA